MNSTGTVISILANLIAIQFEGAVAENEICYVISRGKRLKAEVIRVNGKKAYVQVFESTRGIKVGEKAEFTGAPLEVELGPGLLSANLDGLQSNLDGMKGVYLQAGDYAAPLDANRLFPFTPLRQPGEKVKAGEWLGNAMENFLNHKIMVPFILEGFWTVQSISPQGEYRIRDIIATLVNEKGETQQVTMVQRWPVKLPVKAYESKARPFRILETGMRVIDTFNPIAEGGTGFIPGPFGTGKTVLQQAIARNGEADVVIFIACGERANEVVEIFEEFPHLEDTRTGRKLGERTVIICNTSNMPVAAREASVYTGMTIGEYYRSMGLKVLILADSTSRWAQALREMSNRLEELPGPDAFPVDLPSVIANFYARAGFVELYNGQTGSLTFIGTVSPAGGNLKEPVTESTAKVARCFYALAQKRADSKRYPAIELQDSYSKYLEYDEFREYTDANIQPGWVDLVSQARDVMKRGREAFDQVNILGDDAVPVEYHVNYWKSETIDFALLQQDSFDPVDTNCPISRQKYMLVKVMDFCEEPYDFQSFNDVAVFFKKAINLFRQMNYSTFESDDFRKYETALEQMGQERRVTA